MGEKRNDKPQKHQYPRFYEKIIPIAVGVIALIIVILVIIIVGVIFGWFPGSR
jgi:hypothetical protein